MLGEQSVSFACWNNDESRFVQIQFSIRLEMNSYSEAVVDFLYEPKLPEPLQELAHQSIYDGAHAGLPYLDDSQGMTVKVLQLSIASQPEIESFEDGQFLADILETQIMSAVAGLSNAGQYLDEAS